MEKTIVILKPDAVERALVGEILGRFEKKDLKITNMKMAKLDPEVMKVHYVHHNDKPFFGDLIDYVCRGIVVIAIIEGQNAVEHVRNLMGKTKSVDAVPGTIRGDLSSGTTENLIHGSDSPETAQEEIKRFFPELF